jgi:hypothetical protein
MLVGDPRSATSLGGSLQVRSLFSKYENVGDPLLSNYISSIPESLSSAVETITKRMSTDTTTDYVLNNRHTLQGLISKFHREADTASPAVMDKLKMLSDPDTRILVSIHQPNLFAFGGVFKKIVLLQTLLNAIGQRRLSSKVVNLFLVVDHDFMDDAYIRLAELPSTRHVEGRLQLRLPINESKRWKLVCNMPLPGRTIVDHWKIQIYSWIRNSITSQKFGINRKTFMNNFELFWSKIEESYALSKNYSDFNAFLISKLVNTEWGYDTLFVRLSEMSSVFESGFKYLISNFARYSKTLNRADSMFLRAGINTGVSPTSYLNAPLWLHCGCGSKASARLHSDIRERLMLVGTCMSCKSIVKVDLGQKNEITLSKDTIHRLSPRAIPILLLLARDLSVSGYASGTGGSLGYTLVGAMVFRELQIGMPLTIIWAGKDVYNGIGRLEALRQLPASQQVNIIDYMTDLKRENSKYKSKIEPLIVDRNHRVKNGQPIDLVLDRLFKFKTEQRRIRQMLKVAEKVKNALETKSSIIDYAVNFGMVNTEMLWRRNLLRNDSLAAEVPLSF